jgi:hypothetical protein
VGKKPDQWWESLNLMQEMSREWSIPASRFTDLILKHGDGDPEELELLKEAKHEGLTTWVEGHLEREMKGESPTRVNAMVAMGMDGSERAQAYLDYLIQQAPQRAKPAADSLWATDKPRFAMAVVKNLPGLEAKSAEEFAGIAGGIDGDAASIETFQPRRVFKSDRRLQVSRTRGRFPPGELLDEQEG